MNSDIAMIVVQVIVFCSHRAIANIIAIYCNIFSWCVVSGEVRFTSFPPIKPRAKGQWNLRIRYFTITISLRPFNICVMMVSTKPLKYVNSSRFQPCRANWSQRVRKTTRTSPMSTASFMPSLYKVVEVVYHIYIYTKWQFCFMSNIRWKPWCFFIY